MSQGLNSTIAAAAAWQEAHRGADRLRAVLRDRGCHVYGAGGFGREVAATLRAQGHRLHGFVDSFTGGGALVAGVPCHRPDEIDAATAAASVLVMAVNNFKTPVDDIAAWAQRAGFADIVYVAELPDVLDPALGHYWQASRRLVPDHAAELERLAALLADERSRAILAALARFRITGRPEDHPPVDREHQYFPADLPLPAKAIHLVDCGAFPGDMLEATAAAGLALASWYAFEPDPVNFRHLCQVAAGGGFAHGALFPCGVGDVTGPIRFAEGGADASRAVGEGEQGGITVPVVRVGDVVRAERIDMVKLDVEGFEAAAIDGMVELLDRHRPRLAVAIYHKPADLWEIAFKMEALFPGTRFAMRQHGYNGYDTVLYADLPPRAPS